MGAPKQSGVHLKKWNNWLMNNYYLKQTLSQKTLIRNDWRTVSVVINWIMIRRAVYMGVLCNLELDSVIKRAHI